jgi:hypothetical protein
LDLLIDRESNLPTSIQHRHAAAPARQPLISKAFFKIKAVETVKRKGKRVKPHRTIISPWDNK